MGSKNLEVGDLELAKSAWLAGKEAGACHQTQMESQLQGVPTEAVSVMEMNLGNWGCCRRLGSIDQRWLQDQTQRSL